ncbi:DUF4913 domain-containing protein [Streptomyces subrutilus]|uniref:DUF4913 domain-containing protein n=1 Tax=Streptomyces subrutilus TaxID=36818 RepID=A0A918RAV8_9ACTN|nr:DUF4913 domain-containing protein [Streptomyces subrutilus]
MPEAPDTLPGTVTEDIEDLKAQVRSLAAQLKGLSATPAEPAETTPGEADEGEESDEDGWEFPPFILLLDQPDYDEELRALAEWVEGVLVPGYLAEPSADTHWCHLWTEHPVAIARLHALWLAWQELTDPATCGYSGPSTWHRDHYDPCIRELRERGGPFAGCTKGEHQVAHRQPTLVPSAWSRE